MHPVTEQAFTVSASGKGPDRAPHRKKSAGNVSARIAEGSGYQTYFSAFTLHPLSSTLFGNLSQIAGKPGHLGIRFPREVTLSGTFYSLELILSDVLVPTHLTYILTEAVAPATCFRETMMKVYGEDLMKILVIDDDPGVVEVVSLCFEMQWPNTVTVSAENGFTGIKKVRSENPDLVVLDIGLPEMDGLAVCREIRRFSNVPVLILTVGDRETDVVEGLLAGADNYVTKPFNAMQLLAQVERLLWRAQRSRVSNEELVTPSGVRTFPR